MADMPGVLVVNGWTLVAHPCFSEQMESLAREVKALKAKYPTTYQNKNVTKRLAAVSKLAFEVIPQDPLRPEYRQGVTLGDGRKHWFRAKFFQQYRLFFRCHESSKTIVYAWVNDETTKRAYESKQDAYRVFKKMLDAGHPPDEWDELLREATEVSRSAR
jgi:toxin YhaV